MNLVLIGGKSAEKIKSIVESNFDNLEISIFQSVPKFVELTTLRSVVVDRIILLQDGLDIEDDLTSKLNSFNDYLSKWYPAVRLISLSKDKEMLSMIANIFISMYHVHLHVEKIKPRMLVDIVGAPIDVVKQRYETTEVDDGVITISETIEQVEEPKVEGEKEDIVIKDKKKEKKKRGLFGLFRRKEKKKKGSETRGGVSGIGQNTNTVSEAKVDSVENTDDIESQGEDLKGNENGTDIYGMSEFDALDAMRDSDIDFSVYDMDGETDLGVGVQQKDIEEDTSFGNDFGDDFGEDEFNEDEFNEDAVDFSAFETNESVESGEEYSAEADFFGNNDELNSSHDNECNLDIVQNDESIEEANQEDIKGIEDKVDRLKDIRGTMFNKELDIDLSDIPENTIIHEDIDIEDVNDEVGFIEGIEDLEKDYDEGTTKVVEKVVEKIVRVENGKKAYKNGIRTLIVTGDRRSGVTRTALNLAGYFANSERTLYVDFDTIRKGSLSYLGIENIVDEPENIQNGLALLKNGKALLNVVYPYLKGKFDCLISTYGVDISEEQKKLVQELLVLQREYKSIIIDCPYDNLKYLEDLVVYSEVLICTETNISGVINTILGLSKVSDNAKFTSFIYNNGQYVISKGSNVEDFKTNIEYIREMFALEEESIDWTEIPLIGTMKEFNKIVDIL